MGVLIESIRILDGECEKIANLQRGVGSLW